MVDFATIKAQLEAEFDRALKGREELAAAFRAANEMLLQLQGKYQMILELEKAEKEEESAGTSKE